ncbi:hypothetical protein OS493_009651 [Desmophyllum pertusum]|uniref:Uncharacterized protein n=1 Tax=Desmophyllum pertusum TaxID=174260 RepID=A0A9W9YR67_9CNID|nr:hypothetical protein OS493_009651 [Desmophyllum pertusum]
MSFEDELQTACSVIAPAWDYKESVERSKEKCRTIKSSFSCKKRPSLLDEIGVAKDVIVDSERRKYEYHQMMIAHMAPGGPMKYYEEVLDKLIRENSEYAKIKATLVGEPTSAEEHQSMVENEILWDGETMV